MKVLIRNRVGDTVSFDDEIETVQGIESANGSTKVLLSHDVNKTSRNIVIEDITFEEVAKAVGWED